MILNHFIKTIWLSWRKNRAIETFNHFSKSYVNETYNHIRKYYDEMKKLRIFFQIIIGISIIAFILNKLDLKEVMAVLGETDLKYFILACISYLFLNLVLAFRLSYLLKKIGHNIKYINVFLSHMGGMIVGDITPGRSGYFLTPPIMKKTSGIPITDGMACIFAPQGIEFILSNGRG